MKCGDGKNAAAPGRRDSGEAAFRGGRHHVAIGFHRGYLPLPGSGCGYLETLGIGRRPKPWRLTCGGVSQNKAVTYSSGNARPLEVQRLACHAGNTGCGTLEAWGGVDRRRFTDGESPGFRVCADVSR
ncbi:hypothetical protein SDC9_205434 [bioreactor metagenome]|uniref:Uncharacterized protein n=1 Tax=bioreactor metagenome TaxID=1076179 RepID=A0A645J3P8_9ZZZZ